MHTKSKVCDAVAVPTNHTHSGRGPGGGRRVLKSSGGSDVENSPIWRWDGNLLIRIMSDKNSFN